MTGVAEDGTMLRILQHRAVAEARRKLALARGLVCDKIQSQLDTVRHYQRHGAGATRAFMKRTKGYLKQAQRARDWWMDAQRNHMQMGAVRRCLLLDQHRETGFSGQYLLARLKTLLFNRAQMFLLLLRLLS
jgi:hypothetical protein